MALQEISADVRPYMDDEEPASSWGDGIKRFEFESKLPPLVSKLPVLKSIRPSIIEIVEKFHSHIDEQ